MSSEEAVLKADAAVTAQSYSPPAEPGNVTDPLASESQAAEPSVAAPPLLLPAVPVSSPSSGNKKYIAYTVKLPSEQLSALQSIWLELKRLYGVNSPDKSGMIQQAVADWLKQWDSADRTRLLSELLEIREDTRRRQYRKDA